MSENELAAVCLAIDEHEISPADQNIPSILDRLHKVQERTANMSSFCSEYPIDTLIPFLEKAETQWNRSRFSPDADLSLWNEAARDGYRVFFELTSLLEKAFSDDRSLLESLKTILYSSVSEEILLELPKLVRLGRENRTKLERVNANVICLEKAALIGFEITNLYRALRRDGAVSLAEKKFRDRAACCASKYLSHFSSNF